jgi:hypothetical protein
MTAPNPGQLKLDLALNGVCLEAAALARPELRVPASGRRNVVELMLPEEVVVDAPIANGGRPHPEAYRLGCEADRFVLHRDRSQPERVDVRVIPPPQFYSKLTTDGTAMAGIGTVHGSFLALSPLGGCGLSLSGGACAACLGGIPVPAVPQSVADVVDTVRAAFAEGVVEFILFNGGATAEADGGIAALEPYIRAVKRHFDTFVAVQVHPPTDNGWIDRTYAMGVDAIGYAVEIHDAKILAQSYPGRVARIGRARYYEALAYAATIFPSGTVWSDLVLGIEPPASTTHAIDTLCAAGVLPVLSLVRPEPNHAPPEPAQIEPVVTHLFTAVRDAKINMGWVQDLSFAITPLEARFFVSEAARLSVAQQFYRSRLGGLTARNLARLRRRLRVRTVSDSFDSSHL